MLAINEEFYSIQGEGIHTGIPMYFVRLQGCGVGCYFCDTKYTWRPEDQTTKEEDIIKRAKDSGAGWVCITGGEPMEQDLRWLIKCADNADLATHIETSGSQYQDLPIDWTCLSPKDLFSKKKTLPVFKDVADEIKVVVTKMSDLDYYLREYYPACSKGKNPQFIIQLVDNNFTLLPKILEVTKSMNVRIMMQQHKVMQLR